MNPGGGSSGLAPRARNVGDGRIDGRAGRFEDGRME